MRLKQVSAAVAVGLIAAPAAGQVPDLAQVQATYLPSVALEDPRPAEVQLTGYDALVNGPIPVSDASFLIVGASYHAETVSFQHAPPTLVQLRAFHAFDLSLMSVQLLPSDWSLTFRYSAGFAGDLDIDQDMIRMSAMALATHAFSDRLVVGGGAIASYAFGTFLPLPAGYVEWKPLDGLRVEAFLPAFATVEFSFGDRLEIGYEAQVQGNSYAVRDERTTEAWPCAPSPERGPAQPAACMDHIAYSVVTMGPEASLRLFSSVWLDLGAGHTLLRRFEPLNQSGDTALSGVQNLRNTFYVRGGLTWRIPQ